MLLGRLLRHEEHEHQRHRRAVGGIERNRLREANEGAERFLQALDAPMRYGDTLAEARGAEALAREQAVEYERARKAVMILKQQPGLLEKPLLARRWQVDEHMVRREQLGDQAHGARAVYLGALLFLVALVLVAQHLPVELVGEQIDRGIKIIFFALAV